MRQAIKNFSVRCQILTLLVLFVASPLVFVEDTTASTPASVSAPLSLFKKYRLVKSTARLHHKVMVGVDI